MKTPLLLPYRWFRGLLSALSLFCVMGSLASAATTLYQEQFTNTTGGNKSESTVGWRSYMGTTATDITSETSVTYISSANGNPSTEAGYMALNTTSLGAGNYATRFALVETFSSSINIANSTITWNMGNNNVNVTVRLMVQVDGNWYASSSSYTSSAYSQTSDFAAASTEAVQKSLNFDSSAQTWYAVSLTAGSTLNLESTLTSLSSDNITGIGFYVTTPSNAAIGRLDTLVVSVPEPSTALLLGVGILIVAAGARREILKKD